MKGAQSVRFGVIGCGKIACRHAEQIAEKALLVAVYDVDEIKAKAFAEKYNTVYCVTLEALLENKSLIDVIVVCSPNWLHASHTIQALNAGFHVLCEKPMAILGKDCEAMLQAAQLNQRHLFVVKQNRFNPPVVAVKKAISEGRLGKIFSFQLSCFWNRTEAYYKDNWHGKLKEDGGTLYTQFSHFIDLLYWLLGDVKEVKALRKNCAHIKGVEFEDSGVVLFDMLSGAIGTLNYSVNSYRKNMEGSLTIIAESGTIKIGGQYLNTIDYQEVNNYILDIPETVSKSNDYGFYSGSMSNHDKVYDNIISVLNDKQPAYINAYEAMKTVEIIEKIYSL